MTELQYKYRGSLNEDGKWGSGSARDYGNYGAGLVAGMKGIGFFPARAAFDLYEAKKNWQSERSLRIEPPVSRKAQNMGYWRGFKLHFGIGR